MLVFAWGVILWKDRKKKVLWALSKPASARERGVDFLLDIAFWAALVVAFWYFFREPLNKS